MPLGWAGGGELYRTWWLWLHGGREGGFFYADDSLLASTNLVWIQRGFYVLIGLFEKVGTRTNMEKMVAMLCHPGTIYGRKYSADYGRWMTGEGDPHHVKQLQRVVYGGFGSVLAA